MISFTTIESGSEPTITSTKAVSFHGFESGGHETTAMNRLSPAIKAGDVAMIKVESAARVLEPFAVANSSGGSAFPFEFASRKK
jgi:hypothetical protein